MIDAATISAPYRAVPTDRDYYLRELISAVVGQAGLSRRAEGEMRRALRAQIDPLLAMADGAVAVRAELEAIDRRLDLHTQTHRLCALNPEGGCRAWNDLRRTREQLQRRADREMRALWGGRR